MADNRTMAQMLQAPIEGYEDAIVVPPINANNFELKQPLINLVQSNKFTGRQDPHNHLRFFNKVTSTFRHPEVPNTSVKLLLFPFSLDGEARDWCLKTDFENYVKANDAVLKNVQNQGQNLQNQMANVTSLLTSLCDNFKNSASTSNSGTLPSQTVTNPRQQINAITTRSAKETRCISLDPNPNSYPSKLPYPERMKVREHDKPSAQHSRFLKMFKQLRLEIGLKDALVEMPKFNKWLSSLLRNKEKLEEIAITTVNAECSAIIMNKVPEKLEDPGKFLIPCALQELNRTSALADSGASINLLPHSIFKKLGLEA
ncbi:reverse transcriptase domain-containing protein [Tanacetum coccineum]